MSSTAGPVAPVLPPSGPVPGPSTGTAGAITAAGAVNASTAVNSAEEARIQAMKQMFDLDNQAFSTHELLLMIEGIVRTMLVIPPGSPDPTKEQLEAHIATIGAIDVNQGKCRTCRTLVSAWIRFIWNCNCSVSCGLCRSQSTIIHVLRVCLVVEQSIGHRLPPSYAPGHSDPRHSSYSSPQLRVESAICCCKLSWVCG